MRRFSGFVGMFLGAMSVLYAGDAAAQVFDSDGVSYTPPIYERRQGFAMGLDLGLSFVDAVGYPNKLGQIDNPDYRANVQGVGNTLQLWLGGALRDWLTVAGALTLFGAQNIAEDKEQQFVAGGARLGLRIETFPLFAYGGAWRDFGVNAEFGVATGSIVHPDEPDDLLGDGGALSSLVAGVFYEPLQFWTMSLGPQVSYFRAFSTSMGVHAVTAGLRLSLYADQK